MLEVLGDPGTADRVAYNLQAAANDAVAIFNDSGIDRYNSYIAWVNRHVRMLGGQISQRDIDALLQTRGYWSLRGSDPSRQRTDNLNETIAREIESQRYALENASKEIRSELRRWIGNDHDPIALILDTGVVENYASELDTVDWHELAGVRPDRFLYLVIPRIVLDEIDRHKQNRSKDPQAIGLKSVANAAIRVLWSMFGTGERSTNFSQAGQPFDREGRVELLIDSIEHVQIADSDAELLDRSRTLRAFLPVTVVTFDTCMALRGRAAGIDVVRLETEPRSN